MKEMVNTVSCKDGGNDTVQMENNPKCIYTCI